MDEMHNSNMLLDVRERVAVLIRDVARLDKDISQVAELSRIALKEAKESSEEAIQELRMEFKEIKKSFEQITTTISRIQHIALGVAAMYLIQMIGFDAVLKKLIGLG